MSVSSELQIKSSQVNTDMYIRMFDYTDIWLYNPSINFRTILLATLRHVVQIHRTVITQ